MPSPVANFVEDIDGVRGGVADTIAGQFATVAELSEADATTLTSIRGVGPVLAERILSAARTAVIANHTPDEEPDPTPATRARAQVAEARAASRPHLDVIVGEVADASDRNAPSVGDAASDREHPAAAAAPEQESLPPVVARLAYLVGTTIGLSLRLVRGATQPVRHLLHRS